MTRIIRLFTIGILSVLLFGVASTQDVLACSGIGAMPAEMIDNADFIVRGSIYSVDDSGKNGLMEVYQYLKGQGDQFIVLSAYSPRQIIRDQTYLRSGCNWTRVMPEYTEIILFLTKNIDGSYRPIAYYTNSQRIRWSVYVPTFVESLNELSDAIIGYLQTPPNHFMGNGYNFLLSAPLLITTDSSSQYLLPVDNGYPILLDEDQTDFISIEQSACWQSYCIAISSADTIEINDGEITFGQGFYNQQTISANAFSLSPNPPFIAIWRENQIQIFRMHSTLEDNIITSINATPLYSDTIIANSAAWSPDGQFLVFSDDRGIMLWDIFTEGEEPYVIYETNIKTIQGFSPLGRFLVIGDKENGVSIDLISGDTYSIGIFSPTENYLLSYNNEILQFIPQRLEDMSEIYPPFQKIGWISENIWISLACEDKNVRQSCSIIQQNTRSNEAKQTQGYGFDIQNHLLAIILEEYQIRIEFGNQFLDTFQNNYDLSSYLDSPIASIEWLPSLFYYEN